MSQVQWFPGHMTKAKRAIEAQLKSVDMIIECRDSRAPLASSNPLLDQLIQSKPRLIVLTKRDLSPEHLVQRWVTHFESLTQQVICVDTLKDNLKGLLETQCLQLMKPKHDKDLKRGIKPRAIRALIVGIPNVGKSTMINRLAKRHVVHVENRPGITQALKLIKISKVLEIVDSPGMLWPKFEDPQVGLILACLGSVRESGYELEVIADFAMERLNQDMNSLYFERNQLDTSDLDHVSQLEKIAQNRGFFVEGYPDIEKARTIVVNELSNGLYGKIMWELPNEN